MTDAINDYQSLDGPGTAFPYAPAVTSALSVCQTAARALDPGDCSPTTSAWRGVTHVRKYIPELGPEVLEGRIQLRVFDLELPFTELTEAYGALDEPRAIKVLLPA